MYLTLIFAAVLSLPAVYLYYRFTRPAPASAPSSHSEKPLKSVMQAPNANLAPPKEDPYTAQQLKQYDGSDPSKPIYVAIKGTVFDVSHKRDIYGPGKSYGIFAGKDASKGLGMSSLKEEDAVPDYSGLSEADMKVLDHWFSFFSERYNIVGKVVDLPTAEPPTSNL